ncbi:antitoxin MazE-like protein [Paraburkholderia sp. GAS348]|uniref:antitoxin MazE-like protein n=1 Tax=Paraburkholderia sp. GAS348 TaxID=3035132 RepID=UPI003D1B461B
MRKPATRPAQIRYFVAIDKQRGTSYRVTVPDCPGCHSAGDTSPQARANTLKAIEGWIESGGILRALSRLSALSSNVDYAGPIWKALAVDLRLIERARPRFVEECRRQSLMTRDDPHEKEIMDIFESLRDEGDMK